MTTRSEKAPATERFESTGLAPVRGEFSHQLEALEVATFANILGATKNSVPALQPAVTAYNQWCNWMNVPEHAAFLNRPTKNAAFRADQVTLYAKRVFAGVLLGQPIPPGWELKRKDEELPSMSNIAIPRAARLIHIVEMAQRVSDGTIPWRLDNNYLIPPTRAIILPRTFKAEPGEPDEPDEPDMNIITDPKNYGVRVHPTDPQVQQVYSLGADRVTFRKIIFELAGNPADPQIYKLIHGKKHNKPEKQPPCATHPLLVTHHRFTW